MIPERQSPKASNERGIALVAAVLVVLLSTILVATFMTTTTGERSMSSNVQTAKISLYAADAGVRTEQQQLANYASTKLDSLVTVWSGVGPVITNPSTMFPVLTSVMNANCSNPPFAATGSISFRDSTLRDTGQVYNYLFTIQSTGTVGNTGTPRIQAQGILRVSAERGSFADYLIFTNTHTAADGAAIWFTSSASFDGRVHTNTTFRFAYHPTFQDLVTSVDSKAYYYNGGSSLYLNANNNGTTDAPSFFGGFQRNEAAVTLPPNSFSQQNAALGLSPTSTTTPTNNQINYAITNGVSSSGSTPANGIYPVSGGGIYVQGDLSQAKMWADTTANMQWYQFTQGATVRTIKYDPVLGTESVWNSSNTSGAPVSTIASTRPVIYVNGQISDLRGPDRVSGNVLPAISENNKLIIATTGDIVVQRDVTLDSYSHNDNVLGLFSSGGSVRIGSTASNDCNLDAFVMASGSSGQFTVDNFDSGSTRGTFHLRGGMVAQYYGGFYTFNSSGVQQTGFARDFHYDRRGLIPPYYPTTVRFRADIPSARTLAWKEI